MLENRDLQVEIGIVQGNIAAPSEPVGDNPFRGPFGMGVGMGIGMAADPPEHGLVVSGPDPDDATQVRILQMLDVGTIGSQGIPGDNRPGMGMFVFAVGGKPPGGIAFAIVPVAAILPGDHLGSQGNDNPASRMDRFTTHHPVVAAGGTIPVGLGAAGGTMDLAGTVATGAVKRQQVVSPECREVFQSLRTLQVGKDGTEGRTQMDGINTAGTFPQAGVRRGPVNAEQVPEVPDQHALGRPTPGIPVKVRKGGRLEPEHGGP